MDIDAGEVYTLKQPAKYRVRGPTWTDDEVHKLFLAWSQPKIYHGFLNEKKKKEVFLQLSQELSKYSVNRSWEECRAKIKNLKGDYKKARESGNPQGFRYFALMDKIMTTAPEGYSVADSGHGVQHHPVEIEFEIMSESDMDFREIKEGILPIQISQSGNIIIPQGGFSDGVTALGGEVHIETEHQSQSLYHKASLVESHTNESLNATHGSTPLIVLTEGDTTVSSVNHDPGIMIAEASSADDCSAGPSKPQYPYKESYTNIGKKTRKVPHEISQKRRKLHTISEKMAETVTRILTQTMNSLIGEIKASEESFMMSEEKRRLEDQKREEKMLKSLIAAIRNPNVGENDSQKLENDRELQSRQTMMEMIQSSEDPCAMTFDLLASRITTTLTDQHKETEQMLQQWEFKMQAVEMKHTENLFKMILSAVRSHY